MNADGDPEPIDSEDVNSYLQEIAGDDFTAKDFRTWTGTVLAAWALDELGRPRSKTQARKQQAEAVKAVAAELGNTPAVCRRCYIHPDVMEAPSTGRCSTSSTTRPVAAPAWLPRRPQSCACFGRARRPEPRSQGLPAVTPGHHPTHGDTGARYS